MDIVCQTNLLTYFAAGILMRPGKSETEARCYEAEAKRT